MASIGLVEIYKKVKKSKGWTNYEMAKRLRITATQLKHYEEKPISTREIILVKLFELADLSLDEFWELLAKEAKDADKKRLKSLIEKLS